MKRFKQRPGKAVLKEAILILAALGVLVYADIIVLTKIIEPPINAGILTWLNFHNIIAGKAVLTWHLAFMPLAFVFYLLLGFAAGSWRLFAAGNIFFFSGWADIVFYWMQFSPVPELLPWLNDAPLITWTRFLTGTAGVTCVGLFVAAVLNAILAVAILVFRRG